ncbi:glycosyltransferase [Vacuolonema iberomarrocanum]|uniref:glycosyltransferase n=1 Tax=Vacuolonema iberomarrocanum TaxID=3454632 RepID=UPI001A07AED0|nr:glycosyltransferase [filamentous cyanobacterium LEGE 07170]
MRIAIVTSGFLPVVDGVTVAVYQRVRQLSALGHTVLVLCPSYEAIASVYPNWQDYVGDLLPGVRVVALESKPFMGIPFERNISNSAYPTLVQEIEAFHPDIIHVDEPDRMLLDLGNAPAVDVAQRLRIPCVSFYHTNFLEYMDDFLPLPRWAIAPLKWLAKVNITQPAFNAYDAALTASPTTRDKMLRRGITNAVCDAFLGVDLAAFQQIAVEPDFWQTHYGLQGLGDRTTLLFLGRLTPDKGWDFTVKALRAWIKSNPAAREAIALIIAGDGPYRARKQLKPLGLPAHFLGRVPPDQVPALLTHADLHISTSVKETLGLTALEAAAAGTPILAPRAGGFIDSVQDGKTGLLFEPGNTNDFLEKLESLRTDGALRETLGQQGKSFAADYDWKQGCDRLVQFWERCIANTIAAQQESADSATQN